MADKTLYNEQSIESLSPLEFTRLRPQVYAGDCSYSTQLVVEILSNAIDEVRLGHGNRIEVTIGADNSIRVRDYGQGFIYSMRDDGKSILEASFSVMNTSGKYREDGTYEGTSLGTYGIGSKLTNFLSHWCIVHSYRDEQCERVTFKEGEFFSREVTKAPGIPSGTIVEWQPSEEFFDHVEPDIGALKKLFRVLACLCPGLTIEFNNKGEETSYHAKNGLHDLVDENVGDKEILKNRLSINFELDKNKLDLVLTYTKNYSLTLIPYVNTGLTESGPHITQLKTILTREFNKFFRDKGWLKEKDENLSGEDIQEGMYVVFNITAPNVGYDAQVKSRVTKLDMKPFTSAIAEGIQYWLAANEKDMKILADKALNARKAREAARKARDAARNIKQKDKQSSIFMNQPTKLVDCWGKNRLECELFIAEGDSAANGLVKARDDEKQAVFPIRGKMISGLKNSDEKIFANAEIINLIKALGLELDPRTKKLIYDKRKLRYGKIVAAADADPDGKSIKNLLLTDLWLICPDLVINGHVYVARPPLFRITTKNNKYIFLKDQAALDAYKQAHTGEKYLINRNKGLGEQDATELGESILDYETRDLAQVIVEDVKKADELFNILMGNNVPPRREFLLAHSEEAEDVI